VAGRPPRVYVSGPYTRPNPSHNVRRAVDAADRLWAAGLVPFVPHLSQLWDTLTPRPWADWIAYDLHWVAACDALVRLPGDSAGADLEAEEARRLGIPVYGSVEAAVAALAPPR
jgi:hypothetical protein